MSLLPKRQERRLVCATTVGMSADLFLRGQLGWLRQQGWDVHLVTAPDAAHDRAVARERVTGHPVAMARDIDPAQDLRSLLLWVSLLARLRPSVTSVGTPKAGLLGGLAAWLTRVPRRVYLVRGLRLEGARGSSRALLWLMERISAAVATDVVAVSDSLAEELLAHRLVGSRGVVVVGEGSSNGVHADDVARAAAGARDRLRVEAGLDPAAPVLGFIGRLTHDKGLDRLVAALQQPSLARIPGLTCLVVGASEDPAVAAALAGSGVALRFVPHTDDAWPWYAAMDVLVLPTRREGFPNVVLEAASAGVPTVATVATGTVDAIVDGVTGRLVPGDDASALAEALAELLTDTELRSGMGEAARQRVHDSFAPRRIWEGMEALYRGHPPTDATVHRPGAAVAN